MQHERLYRLVVDPPWSYGSATGRTRTAEHHYETLGNAGKEINRTTDLLRGATRPRNWRNPMFDEQPDGDPHGECAAEINRLQTTAEKVALDIAKWFVQGDRPDEFKLKEWAEALDREAISKAYEWRAKA